MKAWRIEIIDGDGYITVVFAETRAKAKAEAQYTELCQDATWTEIRATRIPSLDGEYRGKREMDWEDPKDRCALVKAGIHCEFLEDDDCRVCTGREFCDLFLDQYGGQEI